METVFELSPRVTSAIREQVLKTVTIGEKMKYSNKNLWQLVGNKIPTASFIKFGLFLLFGANNVREIRNLIFCAVPDTG